MGHSGQPLLFFAGQKPRNSSSDAKKAGPGHGVRVMEANGSGSCWRSPYENQIQNLILFGLRNVVCVIAGVVQNWAMEKVAVVRTPGNIYIYIYRYIYIYIHIYIYIYIYM